MRIARHLSALVALSAASLLAASPALAQPFSRDLGIIEMHAETYSGIDTPQTRVITNPTDYRAFFANTNVVIPPQPRIDWSTEDMLVACMGSKPSSGYGIKITRVELMTGGITANHAFVDVTETTPTPGGIGLTVMTQPVHVVRVPKGASVYHFRTVSAGPTAFSTLDLGIYSPLRQSSERLILEKDGTAQLLRSSPTARYAPINGRASAAELSAVLSAFRSADVSTLPGSIPDPNTYIVAPDEMRLESTVGPDVYTLEATLGVYQQHDARVRPLVAALRAISARLIAPATFETIHLTYSGGLAPWSDEYTIAADGSVVIVRNGHFGNASRYWSGRATPAQLQALEDAVNAADMAGLPATIDDPVLVMDVPSVTITTTLSGQDFTTLVTKAGFFDTFEARLRPVSDAVQAITDRIINPPAQLFSGRVRRSGNALFFGNVFVPWSDPLASTLYRGLGRTVVVKGFIRRTGSGSSYLELESIRATTTANLNMRTAPALNSSVIKVIARSSTVEITGRSRDGNWYMVVHGTDSGWSSASYIRIGN
jgi:hypothetical protein